MADSPDDPFSRAMASVDYDDPLKLKDAPLQERLKHLEPEDKKLVEAHIFGMAVLRSTTYEFSHGNSTVSKDNKIIDQVPKEKRYLALIQIIDALKLMQDKDELQQIFQKYRVNKDSLEFGYETGEGHFSVKPDQRGFEGVAESVSTAVSIGVNNALKLSAPSYIKLDEKRTQQLEETVSQDLTGVSYLKNDLLIRYKNGYLDALTHGEVNRDLEGANVKDKTMQAAERSETRDALGYPGAVIAVEIYDNAVNDYLTGNESQN